MNAPPPNPPDPASGPGPFFRWAHGLALAGDPRMEPLGALGPAFDSGLEELARSVRRSIWHMTYRPTWSEVRMARPLAEVARRRGIDARYITDRVTTARLPLLVTHHHPYLREHPVAAPALLVDGRALFVGAPTGHTLAGQVWKCTAGPVLQAAARVLDGVWQAATPPPGDPAFTRRMVEVAFLLTDGASDREIAKALAVSERTVSADIAELTKRLGARNRAHAIALIGDSGP